MGARDAMVIDLVINGFNLSLAAIYRSPSGTVSDVGTSIHEDIDKIVRHLNSGSEWLLAGDINLCSTDTSGLVFSFELKVEPTACYGVPVIWPYLTEFNLMDLDKLEAAFLKRALGVHRSSSNRIVYLIATVPLLTEDVQRKFNLPITRAYAEHCRHWDTRLTAVDPRVFDTEAFSSNRWKKADFPDRHLLAKFAVHGFHHKICQRKDFHKESDSCTYTLCGKACESYHLLRCEGAVPLTISKLMLKGSATGKG